MEERKEEKKNRKTQLILRPITGYMSRGERRGRGRVVERKEGKAGNYSKIILECIGWFLH